MDSCNRSELAVPLAEVADHVEYVDSIQDAACGHADSRGTCLAASHGKGLAMADNDTGEEVVLPIPSDDEAERKRIRKSNDRDQAMERRGEPSKHNEGYDEAADGVPRPEIENVVDE